MYLRPITVVTTMHFAVSAVVWFLLFGVVLGLGFKSDWGTFDHAYSAIIRGLAYVLCFPSLLMASGNSSGLGIIAVQLISSFFQANIALAVWGLITGRNKAKKAGTR